ncbi:hypothetical protein AC579_3093 [Pseudocercospora musae]|uniref:Uncharacterized protein n=1 Tax=Pseudocercospora musae TaxID=113226 RepID=A0A139IBL7_9PEZI|nr:hypothetical protein AC579_306 [Pseudocercospora musae]KXT11975.1 hypothetical protein AC579_3093 [Pseudocercospora musae]
MFHFGYPFDYAVPARPSSAHRETEQAQFQPRGRAENQTTQARPRMSSRSRTTNSVMHMGYPFDYAVRTPSRLGTPNDHGSTARPSVPTRRRTEMPPDPGYVDRTTMQPTRGRSKTRSRPDSTAIMADGRGDVCGDVRGRSSAEYHSDNKVRSKSRTRETRYGGGRFLNIYAREQLVDDQTRRRSDRGRSRSRSRPRHRHRHNLYQDAHPELLDVARGPPQFSFQHKLNTQAADATTSRRRSRSRRSRTARSPSRSGQVDLLSASRPDLFQHQGDLKEVRTPQGNRRNASSHRFDDDMWRASRPDLADSVDQAERNRHRYENDMFQAGRPGLFRQDGASRAYGRRNADYYRPGGGY